MYLAKITISNFRKLEHLVLDFKPGLNILVGANNIGKTAVVDALRALLAGHSESYPTFDKDDIYQPSNSNTSATDITFQYVFKGLSLEDEADFLPALVPVTDDLFEVHLFVRYSEVDSGGRLRPKRWCGEHEDLGLTSDMLENLRGVYLPPLRDASQGLKPGRNSRLARLLQLLADEEGRKGIETLLQNLDENLKKEPPIANTQAAISNRHQSMLGEQLAQTLDLGISGTNFKRLSSRLSLLVDTFEIEQNGLGYNNLLYMAVVLSEMAKDPAVIYRGLIIEEPEAHLHPQLQAILLEYLENIKPEDGEGEVQIFVTSHSPNFASIAKLDCITCLVDTEKQITAFTPRTVSFEKGKREKLERYLDVTRAELFFARKIIFVEGAAELMLLNVLAKKIDKKYNLKRHAVSLISVDGLNFDSFLPLFGENALPIPVSVITDADPAMELNNGDDEPNPLYPALNEEVSISPNTVKMKTLEDRFIRVFHGVKTFEYDLALYEENRIVMLEVLNDLHPKIYKKVQASVDKAIKNEDKAKALFCGMFERAHNNVQKGYFGQALAQALMNESVNCTVPVYIINAIKHVCCDTPAVLI